MVVWGWCLQLTDVRYEELIKSPTAVLEKIYKDLDLGGWENLRPEIEKYEKEHQRTYKTNKHPVSGELILGSIILWWRSS